MMCLSHVVRSVVTHTDLVSLLFGLVLHPDAHYSVERTSPQDRVNERSFTGNRCASCQICARFITPRPLKRLLRLHEVAFEPSLNLRKLRRHLTMYVDRLNRTLDERMSQVSPTDRPLLVPDDTTQGLLANFERLHPRRLWGLSLRFFVRLI